jgi:hypothetical protein
VPGHKNILVQKIDRYKPLVYSALEIKEAHSKDLLEIVLEPITLT